MDYEFKTLRELYDRITPALTSKVMELKKLGYNYIKESDIWNCLASEKWVNSSELTLCDMVSDIFNSSGDDINNYIVKKASSEMRKPIFDE